MANQRKEVEGVAWLLHSASLAASDGEAKHVNKWQPAPDPSKLETL
jgi:hypothetical protein